MKKDIMLNTSELKKWLRISDSTVYRYKNKGMPYVKTGHKTYRYNMQDVIDWTQKEFGLGNKNND